MRGLCGRKTYEVDTSWIFGTFTHVLIFEFKLQDQDFPGGPVVKNLPANAGDTGSSPGPGRSHMPGSN